MKVALLRYSATMGAYWPRSRVCTQRAAAVANLRVSHVGNRLISELTRGGVSDERSGDDAKSTADTTAKEFSNGLNFGVVEGVLGLQHNNKDFRN